MGSENSILECQYQKRIEGCPSMKYASVACSNSASSGGKMALQCQLLISQYLKNASKQYARVYNQ